MDLFVQQLQGMLLPVLQVFIVSSLMVQFQFNSVHREVTALWEQQYQRNVSQATFVQQGHLLRLQQVKQHRTVNQGNTFS